MPTATSPIGQLGQYSILGSSVARWTLRAGVEPVTATFDMHRDEIASLLAGPLRPVTLKLATGDDELEVHGVYPLHAAPGENPHLGRVLCVDRRWFWTHRVFRGRFNIRRRVGTSRQEVPNQPAISPVFDSVQYAPWSTKDGSGFRQGRWHAQDVLAEVMRACVAAEREATGHAPQVVLGHSAGLEALPIEGLVIDGSAADALRVVLGYLPDMDVTVNRLGNVRIFSRADGSETSMAAAARRAFVDQGWVEAVDLQRASPRRIVCVFEREMELRLDAVVDGGTTTEDERFMDNVLPIPDHTLAVDGVTLAQGTWITFRQAYEAWGVMPGLGTKLSDAICRQAFVPGLDLWSVLGEAAYASTDADWPARIAMVQQHWRRTYRVNRRWTDRLASIHAHRVATIDPTTGTRAPSLMFSNYHLVGTQRSRLVERRAGGQPSFGIDVRGYPTAGTIGASTKPAPARVTIVDPDQFIISFDYLMDVNRLHENVLPSMMELFGDNTTGDALPVNSGPTADLRDPVRPIGYNLLKKGQRPPSLTREHKIATIVTARPGAPNSAAQLHRVIVEPEQIADLVPAHVLKSALKSRGPEAEVFIGPKVERARIAWTDDAAPLIERAFGIGGATEHVNLSPFCVNQGENHSGASLNEIARAQAAAIWAALADREQGAAATTLNAQIEPTGRLSEVHHEIRTDGVGASSLAFPERVEPLDLTTYLGANARRVMLGLVGAGRIE